jgi:asparagine synthase (glutamine-hydrolysing)
MCGISLVVDWGGAPERGLVALGRLHDALRHRGPDGEGWLLVDPDLAIHRFPTRPQASDGRPFRAGIAFRRLTVQDQSAAAAQPLASPDGRAWISHNGEIYNAPDLRSELERHGHVFVTQSDAEVALAAYRQWGIGCFDRFNGMWAILIVDLVRRAVVGSRDRLGIKPFFYTAEPGLLMLASEAAPLAAVRRAGPAVEPRRFVEFLCGLPPQSAELSFFKDVHPVPAGTTFTIQLDRDRGMPVFAPYWRLEDVIAERGAPPTFAEAREQLGALLVSSVRFQMRSAVPVGCLLSGGLDTSVIATLAAHEARANGRGRVPAYSLTHTDPAMNEDPFARAVAEHAGLDRRTYLFTPPAAWASVDDVVRVQGQPLLGQELIAQYHAYRLARQHGSVVVLEGQGADELLGGQPSYEAWLFRDWLKGLHFLTLAHELRVRARRYATSSLRITRNYILGPVTRQVRFALRRRRYAWLGLPPREVGALLEAGRPSQGRSRDPSLLNQYLFRLVKHTNLPVVLLYQDRSSMANGVESRVPYLDHRIVEFCFRLPPTFKIRDGERKRLLLDCARGLIPDVIVNRRDKKIFVSRGDWMPLRRDYADQLRAIGGTERVRTSPWLRGAKVTAFVEDYLRGRHHDGMAVWRLYTAGRWLEAFHPS